MSTTIPYLLAKNAILMGFARFVGCRIRPSIVMLTPTVHDKPGHNRATWPVPTGRVLPLAFPSSTIWTQGPDLLSLDNLQNTSETRKSDKYAVTRKNQRKTSPTRKHGVEFPKRRVRGRKVDTVFICPFGGIFPSTVHLKVVYIGINSVRKHF